MKDEKVRKSIWVHRSVLDHIDDNWKKEDCRSKGEYVERAILFYSGMRETERNLDYLSPVIISSLKSISDESDKRILQLLFKNAVEIAVMNNILAYNFNIQADDVKKVREACVGEVSRKNGNFRMEDAVKWQKG